jgi:hypothetical protein
MSGIERRLTKLEATSVLTARMPVIFITLVPVERDLPVTAYVAGSVWHREPDEPEEAVLYSVVTQARALQPENRTLLVILDHRVAPRPESRSAAAEASGRRPFPPSFVKLVGA